MTHVRVPVRVVDGGRDAKLLPGGIFGRLFGESIEDERGTVRGARGDGVVRRRFRRLGAIRERGRSGERGVPLRSRGATWRVRDASCAAFAEDGVERGVDGDVGEGRGWSARDGGAVRGEALVEGLGEEGGEIGGVLGRARDGDRGGEDDGFPLGPSLGGPSLGAGGGEDRVAAEVAGDGVGVAELVGRERHLASGVALGGLGHGRELGVDAAKCGGDETLQRAGIAAAARQLQGRHRRREDGGRRRRRGGSARRRRWTEGGRGGGPRRVRHERPDEGRRVGKEPGEDSRADCLCCPSTARRPVREDAIASVTKGVPG